MADFTQLPPDPATEFVAPGDSVWRDFFLRQQAFLQNLVKSDSPIKVTGSRGGNAALAGLLTALESKGLIIDNTTV
jgi:hypothetical protein